MGESSKVNFYGAPQMRRHEEQLMAVIEEIEACQVQVELSEDDMRLWDHADQHQRRTEREALVETALEGEKMLEYRSFLITVESDRTILAVVSITKEGDWRVVDFDGITRDMIKEVFSAEQAPPKPPVERRFDGEPGIYAIHPDGTVSVVDEVPKKMGTVNQGVSIGDNIVMQLRIGEMPEDGDLNKPAMRLLFEHDIDGMYPFLVSEWGSLDLYGDVYVVEGGAIVD